MPLPPKFSGLAVLLCDPGKNAFSADLGDA